jgi:hypothetical protein
MKRDSKKRVQQKREFFVADIKVLSAQSSNSEFGNNAFARLAEAIIFLLEQK